MKSMSVLLSLAVLSTSAFAKVNKSLEQDFVPGEVLIKLREWSAVPVIFLTVRDTDEEKVLALDKGADDYLTKPFKFLELEARVSALFRRSNQSVTNSVIIIGDLEINESANIPKIKVNELTLLGLISSFKSFQ